MGPLKMEAQVAKPLLLVTSQRCLVPALIVALHAPELSILPFPPFSLETQHMISGHLHVSCFVGYRRKQDKDMHLLLLLQKDGPCQDTFGAPKKASWMVKVGEDPCSRWTLQSGLDLRRRSLGLRLAAWQLSKRGDSGGGHNCQPVAIVAPGHVNG
jgi:hypothetical protein